METLGFLGGKYQEPELIVPGQVQTLRATDSATGKFVFAHRVSITEEPAEQTALQRLLTTGLVRSPEVKKLVLDFGEEKGFWYVVTQPEPQCILLRQWLQKQLGETDMLPKKEASKPATQEQPPPAMPLQVESVKPESPEPPKPETGPSEFTRLFQSAPPPAEKPAAPLTPPKPEHRSIDEPPAANPVELKSEPSEFTRLFQSSASPASLSPQSPSPLSAKPSQAEPGEFTRFFQGGLPPAAKPTRKEPLSSNDGLERPSRGGFVQRPNTPVPPPSQKPAEPGEFTRLFSRPAPESAKPVAPLPDLSNQSAASRSFGTPDFGGDPRQGSADPFATEPGQSTSEGPGEYTKIFGSGSTLPPLQQASTTAEPPPASLADDRLRGTRIFPSAPTPPAPPPSKAPSEYTMVLQGNRPPADAQAPVSGAKQDQSGPAQPFLNLSAPADVAVKDMHPPVPPPPKIPQAPVAANAAKLASEAAPAVGSSNKKFIILLIVLGVLAVVLMVLVALVFKK